MQAPGKQDERDKGQMTAARTPRARPTPPTTPRNASFESVTLTFYM
jgi:hypothetical protein